MTPARKQGTRNVPAELVCLLTHTPSIGVVVDYRVDPRKVMTLSGQPGPPGANG